MEERRRAARIVLPEAVQATVSGVPVRVLDLSSLGARLQHERRFPLDDPELRLEWREAAVTLAVRVVRSVVIADGESRMYSTGIEFAALHPAVDRVIASIASWAELELSKGMTSVAAEPDAATGEDTWTRTVQTEARPSFSRR